MKFFSYTLASVYRDEEISLNFLRFGAQIGKYNYNTKVNVTVLVLISVLISRNASCLENDATSGGAGRYF